MIKVAMGLLSLSACSTRPETREYFLDVTGIELCESASIKNVHSDQSQSQIGTGFIYMVDISMNAQCQHRLFEDLKRRRVEPAGNGDSGQGAPGPGETMAAERMNGKIRFTYTG